MAEDTLQEAFCRLWARKFSPETLSHAMGVLRVTGRNIEIDEYRRKRKMPTEPISSQALADHSAVSQSLSGQQPVCQPFVSQVSEEESTDLASGEAMTKEMMFRKVESLMDSELTELQKTIIRRHEYQGAPLNKIAKELSMQPAAVRMQISRARKTLRKIFIENEEQN